MGLKHPSDGLQSPLSVLEKLLLRLESCKSRAQKCMERSLQQAGSWWRRALETEQQLSRGPGCVLRMETFQ